LNKKIFRGLIFSSLVFLVNILFVYLNKNYGKKIFVFGDNSFNIDAERVDAFCDLLIDNNTQILWSASIRADNITQQLANKMKAAGCYNVSIGVESANNEILEKMKKGLSIHCMI